MRRPGRLIFSALLFFPYFSPFPGIFLVIWRRLALPRLRRCLKGKKGVNRHASPYRLKNYDDIGYIDCITGGARAQLHV
jgi:hypothetical protein